MPIVETPEGLRYFRFQTSPLPDTVMAAATTREAGASASPSPHPDPTFLETLHLDPAWLAWCGQEHGARILASTHPGGQGKADALVTDRPDLILSIRTADCLPVFLVAPDREAVGLIHAGWRGAAAGIAGKTVRALGDLYGADPGVMWAGLGPAIGAAAYEVGPEVAERFDSRHASPHGDRFNLDLVGAVAADLEAAGIRPENVERSGLCTVERNDLFPSWRQEQTPARFFSLLVRRSESTRS